ncbi:hypothetical protein OHB05_34920 [Streptomyces sp. NBC_00638]|uniref:hypothetical protein n=1 Tax=Streptomyces sp. NBC_00638 TaxID=2975794 RepID=UPI00225644B3|nr:hypothetical protein [Streptomyces sp. NBC_00638]MCX5007780.1 hypothetical protein [Streptomyces sp. NBC_00638]
MMELAHMLHRVERMTAYVPLIGTALILIIQNFFQGFLESLTLNICISAMAFSIALLLWYLEGKIQKFERAFQDVRVSIEDLARDQPRLLGEASSNFQIAPISAAFITAATLSPRVDVLRIYSLSSVQMSNFLQHSGIRVNECRLMIYKPPDENGLFAQQIEAAIQAWRASVTAGRIRRLEIRRYDFFPTQYEAIFDASFFIAGLFHPDPVEISGAAVRDPLTVHAQSLSGARIISDSVDRYDRLFRSLDGRGDQISMEAEE